MPRPFCKRVKDERGFTLLELLAVVVIIAILAAIAFTIFLGQRQKAEDAGAKALVRGAMTAIESAFVDTGTFDPTTAGMLPADLNAIERSINFVVRADAATAPTATVVSNTVNYTGTASTYSVGTVSASGKTFGVVVDKAASITFYVGGAAKTW